MTAGSTVTSGLREVCQSSFCPWASVRPKRSLALPRARRLLSDSRGERQRRPSGCRCSGSGWRARARAAETESCAVARVWALVCSPSSIPSLEAQRHRPCCATSQQTLQMSQDPRMSPFPHVGRPNNGRPFCRPELPERCLGLLLLLSHSPIYTVSTGPACECVTPKHSTVSCWSAASSRVRLNVPQNRKFESRFHKKQVQSLFPGHPHGPTRTHVVCSLCSPR
mmetsp:Transcript_12277/g.28727  ORF Transcript_12277/g.28727 Transcript_12277/m.28727 type:complete len:224 (-) Transcript_12277:68-739(-)